MVEQTCTNYFAKINHFCKCSKFIYNFASQNKQERHLIKAVK
ncbi:hypothetical protein HMPREF9420_2929 [Segatella salivae DSM 15606]|uniref:Uncharacterized protein n=1 Tax=Segatella salivae DSM 15606 TaxID=888832 RepID=E6MTW1_9BACT|nr:hypothetical protein HMPREF9420_2929 [Segatella salivae DSM 15606]